MPIRGLGGGFKWTTNGSSRPSKLRLKDTEIDQNMAPIDLDLGSCDLDLEPSFPDTRMKTEMFTFFTLVTWTFDLRP